MGGSQDRRVEPARILAADSGEVPRIPENRAAAMARHGVPAPEICQARSVSPQSRRRDPAGDRGHRGASGAPPGRRGGGLAGPPPNALFAEMLRAARELLAVRSPLDAELMVSELLGTWWGQQASRPGARQPRNRRRADIEELIGEGLVAYAAQQGSPAALALLSGIACLGTSRQAAGAEQAARSEERRV